jgi:hypothetical protein
MPLTVAAAAEEEEEEEEERETEYLVPASASLETAAVPKAAS